MGDKLKLPPGAQMVSDDNIPLPPGASLVGSQQDNAHVSPEMRQTMHDMAMRPMSQQAQERQYWQFQSKNIFGLPSESSANTQPPPVTPQETQQRQAAGYGSVVPGDEGGGGPGDLAINALGQGAKAAGKAYIQKGPGQIGQGGIDIAKGNFSRGGHEIISGAGVTALPFLPEAAAARPLLTAGALGTGAVAQKGTKAIASKLGASPDQANLAGDIAGVVGGAGIYKGLTFLKGMLPNKAAAGELFNQASQAAGDIPVDLTRPGNTALRIRDLAQSGGRAPKVVTDFIRRTTDPDRPPLTYDEARDFYSNASRISADEAQRLTPVMRYQLGQFTRDLGDSISGAADQAGVLPQYQSAMTQYRRAAKFNDFVDSAKSNAVKYGVGALAGSGGAYALKKILFPGK